MTSNTPGWANHREYNADGHFLHGNPRETPEPPVANDQDLTPAWVAWLAALPVDTLRAKCDQWGAFKPADDPAVNADLVAEKWEAACTQLAARNA